jgi:hypothetical protein
VQREVAIMRRPALTALMVLGFSTFAASSRAQLLGNGTDDPFFLYYGFYLPRQAALAAVPRPENTINNMAAIRQQNAVAERAGLYDPVQPFGTGAFDPSRPFADRTSPRRYGGGGVASSGISSNGSGPPRYYTRLSNYFPGVRQGRGVNASASIGSRGGGGRGGQRSPY